MSKKKQGRPRIIGKQEQKRRNVSLSDTIARKLRKFGGGNLSEGIRRASELIP